MPHDAHPEQPDGDAGSASGGVTPVRPLPVAPAPEKPGTSGGDETRPQPKKPKRPKKKPSASAEPAAPPAAAADSPPPVPPLPTGLIIPPRPPLPVPPKPVVVTEPEVVTESEGDVAESAAVEEAEAAGAEAESADSAGAESSSESDDRAEVDRIEAAETVAAETEAADAVAAETEAAGIRTARGDESALPPEIEPEQEPETEPEPESAATTTIDPTPAVIRQTQTDDVPEVLVAASVDPSTAALVVKGVSKSFGDTRAVDAIDLTVPSGTFYGLVGPNGAGKTTTLSLISGLLRPDRGSISVNGIDASTDPLAAKRQMGVLPDRLRTFDRLTGRQLLHYYGVLRGLPSAVVESRTADLARAFDLTDALGRVVSDYSAGMLKKVMLAGALIHSPRLLVLDEPFESVDPVSSAIILDILSTYVDHGGTVILSSHGMDLVERVCSRVAVIVAGQVLAEGTVDDVRGELTLEQRFIELAGGLSDVEGLEWLHTFSG